MVQNKALIFNQIPRGYPQAGKDLVVKTSEIDLNNVPAGGLILKNYYVSFDPYQRGRMRDPSIKSYASAFALGKPITNSGVSKVLKSDYSEFKEGDIVTGHIGTEEYTVVPKEGVKGFRKVDNKYNLPLSYFVGVLGMPGLTAYSSFYEIGEPKRGETIFISAASGAVGSVVGQLAKREGLRVVGSAGSDEKVAYVKNELGFDEAFNYKTEKPKDALRKYSPEGLDIYFDNVGGETLAACLDHANDFARFIECGMISQYNVARKEDLYPITNLMEIVAKRLKLQGFIVHDQGFGPKYFNEHQENVAKWLANKEMITKETVTDGIDNAVEGFVGMLQGKNFGKAVLKIADLD
ncbi:hypothetical protein RUND412_007668 [Rhizina undulata]